MHFTRAFETNMIPSNPAREHRASRPIRALAAAVCVCAAVATLTIVVTVSAGASPIGDVWRLPITLLIAWFAGFLAARGKFPGATPQA
jgi:hypothetical protein